MASVITAGTASNTALNLTGDTSGELQLKTNNGSTTAMTLTTGGNVGIGTSSPIAPLTIASSTTIAVGLPSLVLQGENNTERIAIYSAGTSGNATPVFLAASTRGTIASPTPAQGGDPLGYYQFGGYDGSLYSRSAWVAGFAAETYSATNRGSFLVFSTTPTGSTTIAERMRITSAGDVGIGVTNPANKLDIANPTGDTSARITGSGAYFRLSSTAGGGGGFSAVQGLDGSTLRWAVGNLGFTGSDYIGFYTGTAPTQQASLDAGGIFTAFSTQSFGLSQYSNKKFMSFNYPPGAQFGGNLDCTDISTPGNGSGLVQMRVTQTGAVGCRGSFSGGQTLNDYAEYFEWSDANPLNEDRIGQTVVLDNGKVRPSTSQDAPNTIIGVVSATAGVVLGSAPFEWSGKYKRDDFGRILMQSETWISWTADNVSHNYKQDEVPADVVVPENAEVRTYQKEILSDNYDESVDYTNREARPEWACIGLVGQVHVKKGQVVGDRWIKMKDVSNNVEIWFIR